jgi:phosphoserine aminotransferase
MRYRLHVEKGSMFNTPNTLGIWVLDRVLSWVEDQGLDTVVATNERKAQKIYTLLDSSEFWKPHADLSCRSRMNVTWRLGDETLEKTLVAEATEAGFSGIKGHRSVGGLRASIYNACPEASVDALVAFLAEFERTRG